MTLCTLIVYYYNTFLLDLVRYLFIIAGGGGSIFLEKGVAGSGKTGSLDLENLFITTKVQFCSDLAKNLSFKFM